MTWVKHFAKHEGSLEGLSGNIWQGIVWEKLWRWKIKVKLSLWRLERYMEWKHISTHS